MAQAPLIPPVGQRFRSQSRGHSVDVATAYLRMDFIVVKTNETFRDALAVMDTDVTGKSFFDLVEHSDRERVLRLMHDLQEEKNARDPAYLPPIYGRSEVEAIKDVPESDLADITQESAERSESLRFRTGDQTRGFSIQARLAKSAVYFVALALNLRDSPSRQQQAWPSPFIGASLAADITTSPFRKPSAQAPPGAGHSFSRSLSDPLLSRAMQGGRPDSSPRRDHSSPRPGPAGLVYGSRDQRYGSPSLSSIHSYHSPQRSRSGTPTLVEGPRELQLPPIIGSPGPSTQPEHSTSSGEGQAEPSTPSGSRQRKRSRISVKEMLE